VKHNPTESEQLPNGVSDFTNTMKSFSTTLDNGEISHESLPGKKENYDKRQIWSVISLQVGIALLLMFLSFAYATIHHMPHGISILYQLITRGNLEGLDFDTGVSKFNFVGVSNSSPVPSFYALMMEVFAWSLIGVLARSEYHLTQIVVQRKEFHMPENISKIIGDTSMGVAIAIAVVAFLTATSLTIGEVELTLKTAKIELIGALAFILGFYHEDTRQLLGSFQKRLEGAALKTGTEKKPD
jgi:hypothetical protein